MRGYAIGGHRDAPEWALRLAAKCAAHALSEGSWLRTGGAKGIDEWAARGAALVPNAGGRLEIVLPWEGFRGAAEGHPDANVWVISPAHLEVCLRLTPEVGRKPQGVQRLMARNVGVLLGKDLKTPVDRVICYRVRPGGTDHLVRCARMLGIRVYNIADPAVRGPLERRFGSSD